MEPTSTTGMILILSTAPDPAKAAELATALVHEQLVACVNIVPGLRSIYSWKGRVHDEQEALMLLKTRAELFEQVRARLAALHPYECPEIVQLGVEAGHQPYLDWIAATVRR